MKKHIFICIIILILSLILPGCRGSDISTIKGYSQISEDDVRLINLATKNPYDNIYRGETNDIPDSQIDLVHAIGAIKWDNYTFYEVDILESNYYFVCGYENEYRPYWIYQFARSLFNPQAYDWYRVDKYTNIQSKLGKSRLKFVYMVYDCSIKRDIISSTAMNYSCKYYINIILDFGNEFDQSIILKESEFILLEPKNIEARSEYPFLSCTNMGSNYSLYTRANGKKYIVFKDKEYRVLEDGSMEKTKDFASFSLNSGYENADFYEELSPYFESIGELTEYSNSENSDGTFTNDFCTTYVGIDVEMLGELILKTEKR